MKKYIKKIILYTSIPIIIISTAIIGSSYFLEIKQNLAPLHYNSDLGFSFDYPKDMHIMEDPTGTRLFVLPNLYDPDNDKTVNAVVISESLNDPPLTPLEWLKMPDGGGADLSKGYTKLNIDGQEAISINGDNWITVDTPDNKQQVDIATLPYENPSKLLVSEMSVIVNSIVFDK